MIEYTDAANAPVDAGAAVVAYTVLGIPLSDFVNLLIVVYLLLQMVEPVRKIVVGTRQWFTRRRK